MASSGEAQLSSMQAAVRTLLLGVGEDITREGLIDTPKRVAKALMDTSQGYRQTSSGVLSSAFFHEPIVRQGKDGLVLVRDIDFASTSEETLLPFHGRCHIAYVPSNGVVLGLSKLARLTKLFAKRMQSQERLGRELACVLHKHLHCQGTAIVIEAKHLTMTATRAVEHTTACISGCFTGAECSSFQEVLCILGLDDIPPGNLLQLPLNDVSTDPSSPGQTSGADNNSSSSSLASGRECPIPPPTPDLSDHLSETSIKDVLSDKGMSDTCTGSGSDRDSEPETEVSDVCMRHTPGPQPAAHHQLLTSSSHTSSCPPCVRGPHTANLMESAVSYLITAVGESPDRVGLAGSARRYVMNLLSSTAGYAQQLPPPLYPSTHSQQQPPNNSSSRQWRPEVGSGTHSGCACQCCQLPSLQEQVCDVQPAAHATPAPGAHTGAYSSSSLTPGHITCHIKVPFSSQCEHHMLPFYGHVHVVYRVPDEASRRSHPVVQGYAGGPAAGAGQAPAGCVPLQPPLASESEAIHQVVAMYTQRLQVQERITHQVADAVVQVLGGQAGAVLVLVDAAHMCMVARGVENHAGHTTSMAVRGAAVTDAAWRSRAVQVCRAAGIQ